MKTHAMFARMEGLQLVDVDSHEGASKTSQAMPRCKRGRRPREREGECNDNSHRYEVHDPIAKCFIRLPGVFLLLLFHCIIWICKADPCWQAMT
jgi:hypothetical protein